MTTSSKVVFYPFDGAFERVIWLPAEFLCTPHTTHNQHTLFFRDIICCSATARRVPSHIGRVWFDFETWSMRRRDEMVLVSPLVFFLHFFFMFFFKFFLLFHIFFCWLNYTRLQQKAIRIQIASQVLSYMFFFSFFLVLPILLGVCVFWNENCETRLARHACPAPIEPNDGTCFNYNRI